MYTESFRDSYSKKNVHTWTQFNSQQLHGCSACPNPEAVASELFLSHIPDLIDMPANIINFVESSRQQSCDHKVPDLNNNHHTLYHKRIRTGS